MKKGELPGYKEFIKNRINQFMDMAGLEPEGFAQYLAISESYMYLILNGTRPVTAEIANRVGSAFDLEGANILRPDYRIPKSLHFSEELNKFYDKYKLVTSYFQNTRSERKDSYYIENDLYNSNIFDAPVYIWELKEYLDDHKKKYTSKRLSQILNYMVDRGLLKKKKKPIKLRNGEYGDRKVDIFYK